MANSSSRCLGCGGRPTFWDRLQAYWNNLGLCGACWDELENHERAEAKHRYQDPVYLERSWQDVNDSG